MRLYRVQHGEAKPDAEDPDRSLTEQGATHVRQVAAAAAAVVTPTKIAHSDPAIWAGRAGGQDLIGQQGGEVHRRHPSSIGGRILRGHGPRLPES